MDGDVHSPALAVHAMADRFLSKQTRASCSAPFVQVARKAVFTKEGLAAANCCSICPALSLVSFVIEVKASGIFRLSFAFRTFAK